MLMVNPTLVNYLKQYQKQYSMSQLKDALISQGYSAKDVQDAIEEVQGGHVVMPAAPVADPFQHFFTVDLQAKETMIASVIGLLICQVLIFFGDFLTGQQDVMGLIWMVVIAVISGIISGFLLSKLYYPIMDFISSYLRFLLPLCDTFFKFLFVPVIIGSALSLFFSTILSGAIILGGAALGGVAGGVLGGFLGGSFLLMVVWEIAVMIVARFIYARFMVYKVGRHYRDYR